MNLPGFTATASLGKPSRTYHGAYRHGNLAPGQSGVAAFALPDELNGMEGLDEGDETGFDDEMENGEETGLDDEMENGEEADAGEEDAEDEESLGSDEEA